MKVKEILKYDIYSRNKSKPNDEDPMGVMSPMMKSDDVADMRDENPNYFVDKDTLTPFTLKTGTRRSKVIGKLTDKEDK